MTLIELLIVIVILATLTAAALPILTPSTNERRIREASRELNSYIAQAQAKAIANQRPYGIALKRLSSDTGRADDRGVCLEAVMVEQPAPYAGFDENSRVRVALNGASVLIDFVTRGTLNPPNSDRLPEGWDADLVPTGVIRLGDVIEVLGTRYRIVRVAGNLTVDPNTAPGWWLQVARIGVDREIPGDADDTVASA